MTEIIWDNEDYRELTRTWNQALCSRFENVFSDLREMDEITETDLTERVYKYSLGLMQAWYKEPSPAEGLSNAEFIGQINDMDELIRLAATMSVYGDMLVPDLVVDKLMEYGQDSMDALVREIMRVDFEASEESLSVSPADYFNDFTILPGISSEGDDENLTGTGQIAASNKRKKHAEENQKADSKDDIDRIRANRESSLKDVADRTDSSREYDLEDIDYSACESQAPQRVAASFLNLIANSSAAAYIPLIVEKAAATNDLDVYVEEATVGFLTVAGYNSSDWMMSWLDNAIETREDLRDHSIIHVVMLAIASANHVGDTASVLALLIRSLDYMEAKAQGARSLALLGDTRAIPFLRSWLQNHNYEMDGETWHEFTSAIRALGGKVDPAEHPARFH